MTNHKQVTFDRAKLKRLRAAYDRAVKEQKDSFTFEGDEYVTQFAKYLIEYLDGQFKRAPK